MLKPVMMQVSPAKRAMVMVWPPKANLGAKALEMVMDMRATKVRVVNMEMSWGWNTGKEGNKARPDPSEFFSKSADASAIRKLNAFMISKTKVIKPVMAKCRGTTKNANGAAATARLARISAESVAYSAASAPTFSGGPPNSPRQQTCGSPGSIAGFPPRHGRLPKISPG